jgi:aminoglycoside 3-N-acetyltransferase
VILALENAVGPDGTIVMPAFSGDLSEPSNWSRPPVPKSWCDTIRGNTPPFYPDLTPTRGIGAIAETFRKQDGTVRSNHPQVSLAARGPLAERITSNHSLSHSLGENSPLARIYELDGWVLLLGVDYLSNSSMHLAEYRAGHPVNKPSKCGAPILVDSRREWVVYDDIQFNEQVFPEIGKCFESETNAVKRGKTAMAESRLFRQRAVVDFTVEWLKGHPDIKLGESEYI